MAKALTPTRMKPPGRCRAAARSWGNGLRLLWQDKLAFGAALVLATVIVCAIIGPPLLGAEATAMNLRARNAPPFTLDRGWLFVLGADTLGRSLLARIVVASRNTLLVAAGAAGCALLIGTLLGLLAGICKPRISSIIMRFADMLMSFPSLLLALVVLYLLQPSISNIILILALTRIPVFLRTVRAEVLEVRERMFVMAAIVLGASRTRVVLRHILPVLMPTLITLTTLELGFMMLTEAGLSFLGLGIQPPEITWGVMVAEGRNYLTSAWWLAFWPGLVIMIATTCLTLLSNWLNIVADPRQRWRMARKG